MMHRQREFLGWSAVLVLWVALAPSTGLAADCVWNGGTGAWDEPSNWSGCNATVPGETDTAIIGAGHVDLAGDITVAGLHFSGGVLNGPGVATTLTVTDSLLLDGGEKSLARLTLVNEGAGQWTAGNWRLRLPSGGSTHGRFHNASGASFEVSGGVSMLNASDNTLRITNNGELIKVGAGLADFNSGFVPMVNLGSVEVQQGQLRLPGGDAANPHEGSFAVAAGARLEFTGHRHHFHPDASVTGEGEVRFPGNGNWTLQAGMNYEITGLTRVSDATSCPCRLRIDTDAFTGSLHMQSGSGKFIEGVNGSLTVADIFDWHTGAIGQQFASGNFTLNVFGGITLHSGISAIAQRGIINHYGTAVFESGTFYLRHPTARFINHPGATFEIQGERLLSYRLGGSDPVHGVFDNRGSLIKTGAEEAIIEGIVIENSGVLDVQAGSLRFTRHASLSQPWEGGRLILNDGVVHSQTPLVFENSRLYGHGVINADVDIDNGIFLGSGTDGSYEAGVIRINGNLSLADTSQFYARLVSDDPQPGVGFGQLQIHGDSPTELRGAMAIHVDSTFVGDIQVGDEFVVMTCSPGCTRFFDWVGVTVPDLSPVFFETLYQGNQVVIRATDVEPVPPAGLEALSDGPVYEGQTVNLSASVNAGAGSDLYWFWTFGDGHSAIGSHVEHVYSAPGIYQAEVTAANPGGSVSTTVSVEVLERPSFAGRVWLDRDADGRRSSDEPWLGGALVSADGPGGLLSDTSTAQGHWRIAAIDPGWWELDVFLAGHVPTTDAPLEQPLPEQGSALTDFGLIEAPAPGLGRITGRVFVNQGQGLVDPVQQALAGRPVSLRQGGAEVASTTSGADGVYVFDDLPAGTYSLQAPAPVGHFPLLAVIEDLLLDTDQVLGVPIGFSSGGTIAGRVCAAAGAVPDVDNRCQAQGNGIGSVVVALEQSGGVVLDTHTTGSGGSFQFGPLAPGDYIVRIEPPPPYFTADGELERLYAIDGGQTTADFVLHRPGRLELRAGSQWQGNQPTPVGGIEFELSAPDGTLSYPVTGVDGRVVLDGLDEGVWQAAPVLASLPAATSITPASRTLTVAANAQAIGQFVIDPAQSIRARCATGADPVGGSAFGCTVDVRVMADGEGSTPGSLVYTASGVAGNHMVLGLDAGSYEVTLIPDNPAWPEFSQTVALNASSHVLVNYPWNPTPGNADLRGFIYHDRQNNGVRQCAAGDCDDPDANGITVRLFDESGQVVATTVTESVAVNNQSHPVQTGHFVFPGLVPGNYEVRPELPVGFTPRGQQIHPVVVTLTVPLQAIHIGYRRFGQTSINGRVFIDAVGNGSFDPAHDNPVAGATVRLFDADGTLLDERLTQTQGQYSFTQLLPGAYRVQLLDPPANHFAQLQRSVNLPYDGVSATENFALTFNDSRPRILVFVDGNGNGQPDAQEQRLVGVQVQLFDAPCHAATTPTYTLTTNASGLAQSGFALNNPLGCARVVNLPPGLAAVQGNGVGVLKAWPMVWLPVQTLGTLTIEPFIDYNGNGLRNAGEPIVPGVTVSVDGQTGTSGPQGASFLVTPNQLHSVTLAGASQWQVNADQPLSVYVGGELPKVLRVPLNYAAAIQGEVQFAGNGATWTAGVVELLDLATDAVIDSAPLNGNCQVSPCPAAGSFAFRQLPPGGYRLRLQQPPAGYLAPEQPMIQLAGNSTVVRNLLLQPAGSISGQVYLDGNFNGQRDSGEPGTGDFVLQLVNDSGEPIRTIQPSTNGQFSLNDLNAGTRYALTAEPGNVSFLGIAITETPGWFSLGSQPQALHFGVAAVPPVEGPESRNRFHGQVYLGPWNSRVPVAGARVISYLWQQSHPAAPGCDQANPQVLAEGFTDANGHFYLFAGPVSMNFYQCLKVVDTPGIEQQQAAIVKSWGGYQSPNGFVLQSASRQHDIPVVASTSPRSGSGAELRFSAFRDDNGNGSREANETLLAGLNLSVAGQTGSTGNNGGGLLSNVPPGLHSLIITPPPGYRVIGPTVRPVLISGEPLELPAIALRPAGGTVIQVFEDFDGDGRQSGDESGVSGVSIELQGPVQASASTGPSGLITLADLPNGDYTVTVTAPSGYAGTEAVALMVSDGALLSIPLVPTGMISGAVYRDHDGDGQRSADEVLLIDSIVIDLDDQEEATLIGGRFGFTQAAFGTREISARWTGVAPVEVDVGAGSANAVLLSQVSPGVVRGVLWLDGNGDGVRQPWEVPLAGIEVTLDGVGSTYTDAHGHYHFLNVKPGSYSLQASLPPGLFDGQRTVELDSQRGVAAGLPIRIVEQIFSDRFSAQ